MKLQFLGTAAAEGVPALWCNCETCQKARKVGGKAVRTRSQALLDDRLLIDFPADGYAHVLQNGINLTDIRSILFTHSHQDHLYAEEFSMLRPGFSGHLPKGYRLELYGSAEVMEKIRPEAQGVLLDKKMLTLNPVKAFDCFQVGNYTVTALPAIHDPKSGPLFYSITDGEKTLLYAHDTHYFADEVWAWMEENKPRYDLVSLDCCNACLPLNYVGHMGLAENIKVRSRMIKLGCADEKTRFICNHFSHNGIHADYESFLPIAGKEGFLVSYDGMTVEG